LQLTAGFVSIMNEMSRLKKLLPIFVLLFGTLYANATAYRTELTFHGFSWGTSMEEVIRQMGPPMSRDRIDGFVSLIWDNVRVSGYTAFVLAYFSDAGLQGGVYYFLTHSLDETIRCYAELQQELLNRYGPTRVLDRITRELRPYASTWNLPGGLVRLRVNTRQGDPVTLWYSSPKLTRHVLGEGWAYR